MDFDSWNELFPEGAISQADITEATLVRALVVYLRKFGYEVNPPFDLSSNQTDNTHERRMFLIRLAQNIDRILKITHTNYTFYYYDLIRPVPKKTAKFLDILLNYFYYYNMYKKDVFKEVNERLSERNNLVNQLETAKKENAILAEKNEKNKEDLKSLSKSIPDAEAELKHLEEQKSNQEEDFQKAAHDFKQKKEKLKELREREEHIKKLTVDNEDALKLESERATLLANIEELKEQAEALTNHLSESKTNMESYEDLRENLKKLREACPTQLSLNYNALINKQKQYETEIESLLKKKSKLLNTLEKQDALLQSYEKKLNDKKCQFVQEKLKLVQLQEDEKIQLKKRATEIKQMKAEIIALANSLEEQREINILLLETCPIVFS